MNNPAHIFPGAGRWKHWCFVVAAFCCGSSMALAELVFEKKLVEVDAEPSKQEVAVTFDFSIRKNAVVIEKMDAPCSCLGATLEQGGVVRKTPNRWESGGRGEVVVRFRTTGFRGTIDKMIYLSVKGQSEATVLTVRLTVPQIIEVDTAVHVWRLKGSDDKEHVFNVKINHDEPVHIKKHSCSNKGFRYEILTIKDGWEYQVKVQPLDLSKATMGIIKLETDCLFRAHSRANIYAVVKKISPKFAVKKKG